MFAGEGGFLTGGRLSGGDVSMRTTERPRSPAAVVHHMVVRIKIIMGLSSRLLERRFVHTTARPYHPPFRPFRCHPDAVHSLLKPVETAGGC